MLLCPNGDMSEWQCVRMAISLVTLFTVTNSLTILHPKNTLLSYNIKISHTFIAIHLYYQFTIAQPNFVKILTFSFHIFAITVVTVVHLNGMLYNMKTFSFVQLHSCTYSQLYTCTLFTAHCTMYTCTLPQLSTLDTYSKARTVRKVVSPVLFRPGQHRSIWSTERISARANRRKKTGAAE